MKEISELTTELINRVNNQFEEKIKNAALKHGFDLLKFSHKELKDRCNLFIQDINGEEINSLEIDGVLVCIFTYPKPKPFDFSNFDQGCNISFEHKFKEV